MLKPERDLPRSADGQGKSIPSLDGVRGFAALVVFVSHAANQGLLPYQLGQMWGQTGVMLFFVLSGFLMAHLYLGRSFTRRNVRSFVVARFARVVPLYWLVVTTAFVLGAGLGIDFYYDIHTPKMLALHLPFLWGTLQLWTVPVEIQFYAFFLFLWFAVGGVPARTALTRIALAGVAMTAMGTALVIAHGSDIGVLPTRAHPFLAGVLIGYLRNREKPVRDFGSRFGPGVLWVVFLAFFLNLPAVRSDLGVAVNVWVDPVTVLLTIAFFNGALIADGPFALMRHPALRFMGTVSYSFYLFHGVLLDWATGLALPAPVALALAFVSTLALSVLSWRVIETPSRRFIRRRLDIPPPREPMPR